MHLGFIGTGTITAAILRGLKSSPHAGWPVTLSPRTAGLAARLAAELPHVTVAPDNQSVIDSAETVILAVRPQVAQTVLTGLHIRPDQTVISLIAATPAHHIAAWTSASRICRAIPLPFSQDRRDVVPVFPPLPEAMALFSALGRALAVDDQATFDLYAATSALMASYFGILETAAAWAVANGMQPADARTYLAGLFANLGHAALQSPLDLATLRVEHATRGGLNEQVFADFAAHGGTQALTAALDTILARIRG